MASDPVLAMVATFSRPAPSTHAGSNSCPSQPAGEAHRRLGSGEARGLRAVVCPRGSAPSKVTDAHDRFSHPILVRPLYLATSRH